MSAKRQRPQPREADERAALRSVPLLAGIDDEQLDRLSTAVDRHHVPANEWLFRFGDPSDAIYIVASGRFAVVGADGQVFREMGSGDSIVTGRSGISNTILEVLPVVQFGEEQAVIRLPHRLSSLCMMICEPRLNQTPSRPVEILH